MIITIEKEGTKIEIKAVSPNRAFTLIKEFVDIKLTEEEYIKILEDRIQKFEGTTQGI